MHLTYNHSFDEWIWLTFNFFFLKACVNMFQRIVFFGILTFCLSKSLTLRTELPEFVFNTLVETWDDIIFLSLSVSFPYALTDNAQIFEEMVFQLADFSYSFGVALSLAKQLMSSDKMLVSSA